MPQVPIIGLLFSGLLMLASCGDPDYQVRHPLGYGPMPPEETWVAVESAYQSPPQTVYFDPETIRRDGDLVTLWQLTDYRMMKGAIVGRRFMSIKTQKEFDCAKRRYRSLASSTYSRHMGTGTEEGAAVAGVPRYVEPGSINHALWEVACGKS